MSREVVYFVIPIDLNTSLRINLTICWKNSVSEGTRSTHKSSLRVIILSVESISREDLELIFEEPSTTIRQILREIEGKIWPDPVSDYRFV